MIDARRLLYWTDLEARRRVGPARRWGRRALIAGGLAGLVAWRAEALDPGAAFGTWHVIITAAFAISMIATALGMFWRQDAALLARLPIAGRVLLQAAVIRAVRAAIVTGVTVAIAAAPLVGRVPDAALLRGLALVGTLTVAAAALIPAAAATAALLVAGSQLASAVASFAVGARADKAAAERAAASVPPPTERLPTTWLGALPGTAAAWMVILAITVRWWIATGETTAVGSAPTLLAIAVGVSLVAIAAVWRRGDSMAIAMREVAALDRQRLAHLEIHPPRGLERPVMKLLDRPAALVFGKDARLMRRRYPMAWVVGFLAWIVGIAVAIWKPTDGVTWSLGLAVATGAYAVTLASRLHRPPIELPRIASNLPLPPTAASRARVAWVLLWIAVFAAPPVALATRAVSGSGALVTLGTLVAAAIASALVAARR